MSAEGLMKTPIPFIMMGLYILCVFFLSYKATITAKLKRKNKDQTFEDYYTGGKSMNALVVGLVTIVTFYSGTTFTGRVGFFYNFGVVGLTSVFSCAATGVVMFFLAEKVWPISKKYRLATLSDMLELRYQSKQIKLLTATIIVCFNVIWLITEIRTLGITVNIASGGAISNNLGAAIIFAIIALYVCTGGVRSVAAVDSFSSAIMLAGSIVTIIFVIARFYGGDIGLMFQMGVAANPANATINPTDTYGMPYWISSIVLGTLVMLVYPSNYMSICMAKSVKAVKKSSLATALSGPWLVVYGIIAFAALGLGAQGITINDPQASLLEMLSYSGSGLMLGLVTTFVLAASLGTLDSTLISLSALVSNDIITNGKNIAAKEPCIGATGDDSAVIEARTTKNAKNEVRLTRVLVIILGIVAFCLSLTNLPLLVLLTNYATNGLVQIVPTAILGMYWKKSTPIAAMVAMPVGVLSYLGLDYYANNIYVNAQGLPFLGGFFLGTPALVLNILVFVIISLCTYKKYYADKANRQGIYDDFFVKGRVSEYLKQQKATEGAAV